MCVCAYLCESTWSSLLQAMANEYLIVGPQTLLAGSLCLLVESPARYNSAKQLPSEMTN